MKKLNTTQIITFYLITFFVVIFFAADFRINTLLPIIIIFLTIYFLNAKSDSEESINALSIKDFFRSLNVRF